MASQNSSAWEMESAHLNASTFSIRDILHIIFKRKRLIGLFFIGCLTAVVLGTFLVTPTYRSTAQVLVKLGRENIYVPATGGASPIINFRQEEQINSEIEILKSRTLAEKVVVAIGPDSIRPATTISRIIEKIMIPFQFILPELFPATDAHKRALNKLQNDLTVESVKKSNIIEITFDHNNPQISADVVNTLASFFLDRHVEIFRTPQSYEFFQQQSQFLREKLNQTEARFQTLKEQYNVTDLKNQQSLLLNRIAGTRSDLESAVSREVELSRRIENLRAQLAKLPQSIPQGEQSNPNELLISTLEGRLADLQIEEQRLSTKYTDENRTLRSVREEIALIRKQISDKETRRYGRTSQGISTTYLHLQEDQLRSEADLSSVKAKRGSLQDQLSAYEKELGKLNQIETALNQLAQEVNVDRDNYRLYLTKFEESRISNAMDSEKITGVSLIEAAHVPLKPVKPRILLNLGIGLILSLFTAFGAAFLIEFISDTLEKTEDIEAAFGLPVLSVIPELKKQPA